MPYRAAVPGVRGSGARAGAVLALLLGVVALLSACSVVSTTAAHSPTPTGSIGSASTSPTATAAATATLPPLTPQQGWQAVLTLAESGTSTQSNDSFTASAPYMIEWACLGSGSFKITYGSITATTTCTDQPTLHGTSAQTPNPPGQQVAVTAVGQGDVSWEALVEMQG